MDEKVFSRWVKDAEDFFGMVVQFKELRADYKQQMEDLATVEERKTMAIQAAQSFENRVSSAKAELAGLQNSIRTVGENLREQKDKARQEFDSFVTSIQSEEKAINASIKKKQSDFDAFCKKLDKEREDRQEKFEGLVASHEQWKRAHGLA